MHALLKNRASSLVQRRQLDINDQAEDFLNAQAGKYEKWYSSHQICFQSNGLSEWHGS